MNVKIGTSHITQTFLNRTDVEYNPNFLVIWKAAYFQYFAALTPGTEASLWFLYTNRLSFSKYTVP